MATVTVVKGSPEEAILRAQYGDKVNINYGDRNQFVGKDRYETNKMYQEAIGQAGNDAGDLWGYGGSTIVNGYDTSAKSTAQQPDIAAQIKAALDAQTASQTTLYNQQAEAQAAKIRQAIERQAQQGEATKTDYTNQMNTAIGTLNTERAKIPGQVTNLNNQASSSGMVNADHIRSALAQMGLLQSGESASQQLLNNTTVQNNINANNLQGQELDASYGNQIASAQTDLAAKVKQINDAIALAQAQGDESSLLVLQDAQAKIANAGATNAASYLDWAYKANQDATQNRMAQQEIDAKAVQDAFDNVYRQNQADLAARQWDSSFGLQQGQLLGSYNGQPTLDARQLVASQAKASTPKYSYSRSNTSEVFNEIDQGLSQGISADKILAMLEDMASSGRADLGQIDLQAARDYLFKKAYERERPE